MAVKIRLKKMGRTHRPFFRVCAMDTHSPRDGRAIEELGTYDPMIADTDARASLKSERIDYWLSVGAQPSQAVATLIKKYGTNGTHLDQQKSAVEKMKLARKRVVTTPTPAPAPVPAKAKAAPAEEKAAAVAEGAPAEETPKAEAPQTEAPKSEESAES